MSWHCELGPQRGWKGSSHRKSINGGGEGGWAFQARSAAKAKALRHKGAWCGPGVSPLLASRYCLKCFTNHINNSFDSHCTPVRSVLCYDCVHFTGGEMRHRECCQPKGTQLRPDSELDTVRQYHHLLEGTEQIKKKKKIFWRHLQVLVPWPGIKPVLTAMAVWSLNYWTMREVP